MATYKFNDIKDKIRIVGRAGIVDGDMIMDMTAAGFEFNADFEGDISFEYDESCDARRIGLIIDDFHYNMTVLNLDKSGGRATFKINAKKRVHKVRIVKISEYNYSGLALKSISFNGEFCDAPQPKKLKFEFYGDSMTCGYGAISSGREDMVSCPLEENGYLTYCAHISKYFNADFNVAAASGFGILRSYGGSTTDVYTAYFDKLSPKRKIDWDFSSYIPDVVFINLGTNDQGYTRNNPDFSFTYDEVYAEIDKFISRIRSNYPNCHIVIFSGIMGDLKVDDRFDADRAYREMTEKYKNCLFIDQMYTAQLGGNWHPNLDDHAMLAIRLIEKLKQKAPEVFK